MKKITLITIQCMVIIFYIVIALGSATQQKTAQIQAQSQLIEKYNRIANYYNHIMEIAGNTETSDPEKLDLYKYIYFPKVPVSVQEHSNELWNQINDTLQKCGLNISTSKLSLLKQKDVSVSDIITCTYTQRYPNVYSFWIQKAVQQVPVKGIYSIVTFTNYKNDTILLLYNNLIKNNSAKNLEKSMSLCLTSLTNYRYGYSNWFVKKIQQDKSQKENRTTATIPLNNSSDKSIAYSSITNNKKIEQSTYLSDIDKNIPQTQKQYPNRFALIIGNEDYSTYQKSLRTEANVEYAANDAKTFKEYAHRTLGIAEGHIVYKINATSIEMNRAINQISMIIQSMNGNAEVFVYYAGHGFPDQNTKEPYLIPVDVTSTDLNYAIKLHDLYTKLTAFPSKRIVVFLDACFSGGGREQGLLASRGINIEPKNDLLTGNIIVFSSSSSTESSLPYDEKKHGMFTYFLLKEIQTTSGNITYKKLSDYLREQVNITSVINHAKEQIPEVNVSYNIKNSWENWSINNN